MRTFLRTAAALSLAALMPLAMLAAPPKPNSASTASFTVPVVYYKLPNGLRVALSPDHSSPTVAIGVYYRIGFRVEPRDRTGWCATRFMSAGFSPSG